VASGFSKGSVWPATARPSNRDSANSYEPLRPLRLAGARRPADQCSWARCMARSPAGYPRRQPSCLGATATVRWAQLCPASTAWSVRRRNRVWRGHGPLVPTAERSARQFGYHRPCGLPPTLPPQRTVARPSVENPVRWRSTFAVRLPLGFRFGRASIIADGRFLETAEITNRFGRGGGIRTRDIQLPKLALYQAELRPDGRCLYGKSGRHRNGQVLTGGARAGSIASCSCRWFSWTVPGSSPWA
jgi:hypothetical protein